MIGLEVGTVEAWHQALNGGDIERVLALSHPDIEVGGPRGSGRGSELLREWVGRAGIYLKPRRVFRRENIVVVEQGAVWRSKDTGRLTSAQTVASVFVVRDGRIASVVRYPDVAEALRVTGVTEEHEIPLEPREQYPQ